MQLFPQAVRHGNIRCDTWYTVADTFDHLERHFIVKAHAVCVHNNRVLLVHHTEWGIWGLPGGSCEPDESPEQTLIREIAEETNCTVDSIIPLSYEQVMIGTDDYHYRLHYIAHVVPGDEFVSDIAGSVGSIGWFPFDQCLSVIEQLDHKQAVLRDALQRLDRN